MHNNNIISFYYCNIIDFKVTCSCFYVKLNYYFKCRWNKTHTDFFNRIWCMFLFFTVKRETVPTPPPVPSKPALTEEELEKKSIAIIEEYLHINDLTVHLNTSYHTRVFGFVLAVKSSRCCSSCCPEGGAAVCHWAGLCVSAVCVRADGNRVDAGAQRPR